jgi:hypothetical protein
VSVAFPASDKVLAHSALCSFSPEQPDYRGHVMSNHLGFYVVALTDHDYPSNAVAALLIRILQRVATAPSNTPYGPLLQYFLKLFTNPPADASVKVTAADVSKDIQEVIEIMVRAIFPSMSRAWRRGLEL